MVVCTSTTRQRTVAALVVRTSHDDIIRPAHRHSPTPRHVSGGSEQTNRPSHQHIGCRGTHQRARCRTKASASAPDTAPKTVGLRSTSSSMISAQASRRRTFVSTSPAVLAVAANSACSLWNAAGPGVRRTINRQRSGTTTACTWPPLGQVNVLGGVQAAVGQHVEGLRHHIPVGLPE